MKTLFAMTFSLLTLSTSPALPQSLTPDDGPSRSSNVFTAAVFPAANQSKIWLYLKKLETTAKVTVELLDADGGLMFRETLPSQSRKRDTYRQQFDLSQLTDGRYTIRLSSGSQVEKRVVNLSTSMPVPEQPLRLVSMN